LTEGIDGLRLLRPRFQTMGDPLNSSRDDRWVTTAVNNDGTTNTPWPDQQTIYVPSGRGSNLWDPYHALRPFGAQRGGGIQTHTGKALDNVPPIGATRLPRSFPATMPGIVARNQGIPNASSVQYSLSLPITESESYQGPQQGAHQAPNPIFPVSWREPLSQEIDLPRQGESFSLKKQSDSPVIQALQQLLQERDKELSLKNDIIRRLLQSQDGTKSDEAGTTASRSSRKRVRKADPTSESSDSDGTLNETTSVPVKRSRFDDATRRQTALTRELHACIRCRRLKARVKAPPS